MDTQEKKKKAFVCNRDKTFAERGRRSSLSWPYTSRISFKIFSFKYVRLTLTLVGPIRDLFWTARMRKFEGAGWNEQISNSEYGFCLGKSIYSKIKCPKQNFEVLFNDIHRVVTY